MNAITSTGRLSQGPASVTTPPPPLPRWLPVAWVGFVVVAMLALDRLPLATWGWVVPLAAALLVAITAPLARSVDWVRARPDLRDLALRSVGCTSWSSRSCGLRSSDLGPPTCGGCSSATPPRCCWGEVQGVGDVGPQRSPGDEGRGDGVAFVTEHARGGQAGRGAMFHPVE